MNQESSLKPFLILWFTQGLSVLGNSLTYFSIIFWLTNDIFSSTVNTGDLTVSLTLLGLATMIPGMLISLYAGVWVDRFDRKKIMIAMDFGLGVVTLILLILFIMNVQIVWIVFLLVGLMSLLSTIHSLAFSSSYIMLVPERHLPRANSMMQTMYTVTALIAPTITAIFISLSSTLNKYGIFAAHYDNSGIIIAYLFDSITFFVSAISIFLLQIKSPERQKTAIQNDKKAFLLELRSGWGYFKTNTTLIWLLLLGIVVNIINSTDMLIPVIIREKLNESSISLHWNYSFSYAFLETLGFLGSTICGVVLIGRDLFKKHKLGAMLFSLIVCSLTLILFGLNNLIIISGVLLFIKSFVLVIYNIYSSTIWQTKVPAEMQGRVFGVIRFFSLLSSTIGLGLVGIIGAVLNTEAVYLIFGVLLLLLAASQMLNQKLFHITRLPQTQDERSTV